MREALADVLFLWMRQAGSQTVVVENNTLYEYTISIIYSPCVHCSQRFPHHFLQHFIATTKVKMVTKSVRKAITALTIPIISPTFSSLELGVAACACMQNMLDI